MNGRLRGHALPATLISLLLAAGLPPIAASGPANPCQADIARLCKGVPPGGGRVIECLKEREAEISPACREHVQAALRKIKTDVVNWQKACHADAQRLCKGVPFGQGRVIQCLQEHIADLSAECRGALSADGPCETDLARLCGGVQPGGGRVIECLRGREGELSPDCRAHVRARLEQIKTDTANWQKACHADAQRLCKGVPFGQGRVIQCLREHIDEVSPECKGALR